MEKIFDGFFDVFFKITIVGLIMVLCSPFLATFIVVLTLGIDLVFGILLSFDLLIYPLVIAMIGGVIFIVGFLLLGLVTIIEILTSFAKGNFQRKEE
jgi:hypothetical protein